MSLIKTKGPIILFDGVCNLCQSSVKFCLKNEDQSIQPLLKFTSLQSEIGKKLLLLHSLSSNQIDSVVFVDRQGEVFIKSMAIFKICKHLRSPFNLLQHLQILPSVLTDFVYDIVAANRYHFFGKKDQSEYPTDGKHLEDRFLS